MLYRDCYEFEKIVDVDALWEVNFEMKFLQIARDTLVSVQRLTQWSWDKLFSSSHYNAKTSHYSQTDCQNSCYFVRQETRIASCVETLKLLSDSRTCEHFFSKKKKEKERTKRVIISITASETDYTVSFIARLYFHLITSNERFRFLVISINNLNRWTIDREIKLDQKIHYCTLKVLFSVLLSASRYEYLKKWNTNLLVFAKAWRWEIFDKLLICFSRTSWRCELTTSDQMSFIFENMLSTEVKQTTSQALTWLNCRKVHISIERSSIFWVERIFRLWVDRLHDSSNQI